SLFASATTKHPGHRRGSPTDTPRIARTASETVLTRLRVGESSAVNPFVEITQDTGRHTPDVSLSKRDRVVVTGHSAKFATLALMVVFIHQEGKRHLERLDNLACIEHQMIIRGHASNRRQDAKAGERQVEIQVSDRIEQAGVEPNLFVSLSDGRRERARIVRLDLAAGKCDLAGVARQLARPQRQQHTWLRPIDY